MVATQAAAWGTEAGGLALEEWERNLDGDRTTETGGW